MWQCSVDVITIFELFIQNTIIISNIFLKIKKKKKMNVHFQYN